MNQKENHSALPFAEEYWQKDGGNKWADYIDTTETSLQVFSEKLLDSAAISPAEIILDVGCGGGANSIGAAHRTGANGSVTGIDISSSILAIARERGAAIDNLNFVLGDAASTNLGEEVFDLIFSRFGVMFFSKPVAAFTNIRRALKKNGRLVCMCWRAAEENPWMSVPAAAAFSVIPPKGPAPQPNEPGPFSMAEEDRIVSILSKASFTNISIEPVDANMQLGTMEQAVQYFLKMGPAAATLVDATDEQKSKVADAMQAALLQFEMKGRVAAPAAVWLVEAAR